MFWIFNKPTLRKRVLVLSSLPETEADFIGLCSRGGSDFIRSLKETYKTNDAEKLWLSYRQTAQHLQCTLNFVQERGGSVVRDFNLTDLSKICNYDYVVLLAHHSNVSDEIEIEGTLVRTKNFIGSIPSNCKIVLDITSCYSAYLIPKIKSIIPDSKIIGIDIETSLDVRLEVLKQIVKALCKNIHILQAIKDGWESASLRQVHSDVKLGGKLQSSVYAPREAVKGEDFVVSIFLHKDSEQDEVTIMSRSIDENAEKRNSMYIKTKLHKGDVVEFQLWSKGIEDGCFDVDEANKSITWNGEIESVEYIVSIPLTCTSSSFVGKIIMAVNHEKVGDMAFRIKICSSKNYEGVTPCTSFSCSQTDKHSDMKEQKDFLISNLLQYRSRINSPQKENKELEMCDKCLEILQKETHSPQNDILRVFISSTSDMRQYRKLLKRRVEECEMYPDMYEMWGQDNKYPRDMCIRHVLNSDIFVCILGANYGFVEPLWGKSMTEIEYRTAAASGLPILVYIDAQYKEKASLLSDADLDGFERQKAFITELSSERLVYQFQSLMSLEIRSHTELINQKLKLQS